MHGPDTRGTGPQEARAAAAPGRSVPSVTAMWGEGSAVHAVDRAVALVDDAEQALRASGCTAWTGVAAQRYLERVDELRHALAAARPWLDDARVVAARLDEARAGAALGAAPGRP